VVVKNREKWLGILAGAAIALYASDKLILSPLTASWKDRSARIERLRKDINQGTQLIGRDRSLRERWSVMNTNTLPSNLSAAENLVFKAFDRWSQDSRISIASLKPQWKRNADDFMTLECRADATGDIQSISKFLFDLEKDPLALKLDSLEITARDDAGQQLSLALQVSGLLLNPPAE
jgi:hypothetical protein